MQANIPSSSVALPVHARLFTGRTFVFAWKRQSSCLVARMQAGRCVGGEAAAAQGHAGAASVGGQPCRRRRRRPRGRHPGEPRRQLQTVNSRTSVQAFDHSNIDCIGSSLALAQYYSANTQDTSLAVIAPTTGSIRGFGQCCLIPGYSESMKHSHNGGGH